MRHAEPITTLNVVWTREVYVKQTACKEVLHQTEQSDHEWGSQLEKSPA